MSYTLHIDKNPGNQEESSEMFKSISEAYDVLSDPVKRRDYDYELSNAGNRNSVPPRRSNFTRSRAEDVFEAFFSSFQDDVFFNDPVFANLHRRHHDSSSSFNNRQRNDPMQDIFRQHEEMMFGSAFGGMGNRMGLGGGFGQFGGGFSHNDFFGNGMGNGMMNGGGGGFTQVSSSSSSSFGGAGRTGRSVSTSTYIDSQGRRTTKTETTIFHPGNRTLSLMTLIINYILNSNSFYV